MYLYLKGTQVPDWLEKREQGEDEDYVEGSFTFASAVIVYNKNSQYHVRRVIGLGPTMILKGAKNIGIHGQCPKNDGMPVLHYAYPLMDWIDIPILIVMAYLIIS